MGTRRSIPAKPFAILVALSCIVVALIDCHEKSHGPLPTLPEPVASNSLDGGQLLPPGSPVAYAESAMVKIRPELPAPSPPPIGRTLQLVGARNEFLSFQIVVFGGINGGHDAYVSFDRELKGPGSIGGGDVTLYREELIQVDHPTFINVNGGAALVGRWPDALVPDVDEIAHERRNAFPFKIPPNEARAVWVDVHVPPEAQPGVYEGSFTVVVTADGFAPTPTAFQFSIPVSLTVADWVMPSTPTLATSFLFWVPWMCDAHNVPCDPMAGEARLLLQRYLRMALEHRISLSNVFRAYGTPEEWAPFDAAYGPFLDGTAETRLPGARLTSVQYVGPRDPSAFAAFARHYKDHGWFDRAYDFSSDEPPWHMEFSEAAARANMAHQATVLEPDRSDPPLRTLVTTDYPRAAQANLLPSLDVIVPLVNFADSPQSPFSAERAHYEAFLEQPRHGLWLYQSCATHGCGPGDLLPENGPDAGYPSVMIDASAAKNRSQEWVCFRLDASGEFYFETVNRLTQAWTDQYIYSGNGEGTLFYPGTPARIGGTTPVPVASIRMKLIRLGIQDYEWLRWVSDHGNPACAREAAQRVAPTSYQIPDNGAVFDLARQKLLSCLTGAAGAGN